ncbi:hypothetical protein V6Z12_A12G313400 [Gossypium hirsutum]
MRFLFIFLNSHQLKHHGRASSSWFFIFLLQVNISGWRGHLGLQKYSLPKKFEAVCCRACLLSFYLNN